MPVEITTEDLAWSTILKLSSKQKKDSGATCPSFLMEPEFYSFAQSDKDGAMGDKDLSPREEYFAVTFTSQPPKVKPIILTVPQAATSAFSVQKVLLPHRLRLPPIIE